MVVVIAEHCEATMPRSYVGQYFCAGPCEVRCLAAASEFRHRDKDPSDYDQIRTLGVDQVDDTAQVTIVCEVPEMYVADLRQSEAVQCARQPGQNQLHSLHSDIVWFVQRSTGSRHTGCSQRVEGSFQKCASGDLQ
jgi:hypothetical protein